MHASRQPYSSEAAIGIRERASDSPIRQAIPILERDTSTKSRAEDVTERRTALKCAGVRPFLHVHELACVRDHSSNEERVANDTIDFAVRIDASLPVIGRTD